ncbi:YciI family protein [Variovorax sp. J22P168]|uniref:YciI family protein n=1 Tax=Variovorax jilinensis TaxID=3053513 RepID=UPI002575AAFD|nr:YciI family protein [Variovorax sp. J22P168]MDM0012006.1 YciI family protein [Variovorax sp. J22P168]
MFVITLTYIRPLDELDALMPKHVAWLKKHYKSGLFIASGRQVPRNGGVILARSGDRQALEAILQLDPFVKGGCARADVLEFAPSMTARGAEVLKNM